MVDKTPEETVIKMLEMVEDGYDISEIAAAFNRTQKGVKDLFARRRTMLLRQGKSLPESKLPPPVGREDTNLRAALASLGKRVQAVVYHGEQAFILDGVRVPSYAVYEAARLCGWKPEGFQFKRKLTVPNGARI